MAGERTSPPQVKTLASLPWSYGIGDPTFTTEAENRSASSLLHPPEPGKQGSQGRVAWLELLKEVRTTPVLYKLSLGCPSSNRLFSSSTTASDWPTGEPTLVGAVWRTNRAPHEMNVPATHRLCTRS